MWWTVWAGVRQQALGPQFREVACVERVQVRRLPAVQQAAALLARAPAPLTCADAWPRAQHPLAVEHLDAVDHKLGGACSKRLQ